MRYAILLAISALSLIGQSTSADIQTLDEAKLKARTQSAKDLKEAAQKELREIAREWALRGFLLATQFRFAESEAAYRNAVEVPTVTTKTVSNVGSGKK